MSYAGAFLVLIGVGVAVLILSCWQYGVVWSGDWHRRFALLPVRVTEGHLVWFRFFIERVVPSSHLLRLCTDDDVGVERRLAPPSINEEAVRLRNLALR